jgi:WD40 repeat protein
MLRLGSFSLLACVAAAAFSQGQPDIIDIFGGHRSYIMATTTSADGARTATAQSNGPISIFDAGTGRLIRAINVQMARALAFSPDGQELIAGDWMGFSVFNSHTGAFLRRVQVDNPLTLSTVAISADGTRAGGSVSNGIAIVWNLETATVQKTFPLVGMTPMAAAFNANGSRIAIGNSAGHVISFDSSDGSVQGDITAHTGNVTALSYQGNVLVSAGGDRLVKTWNAQTGAFIRQMQGHTNTIYVVRMSPDGSYVVSGAGGGQLYLWNASTGGILCALWNHQGAVRAATFTSDSSDIVSGDDYANVLHWQIMGLILIRNYSHHRGEVNDVAISPDGKTVASGSADGTVKLWRGATLNRTINFGPPVNSLAFAPNNIYIAASGGVITTIYNAFTGASVGMTAHGGVSVGSAFSLDSQYVYSCCTGGELKKITTSGSQVWLAHFFNPVMFVAVPPSGNFVAGVTIHSNSSANWSDVQIVNSATGVLIRSWTAHTSLISGLAFTPNGTLVTSFEDGTIRAWDPTTGSLLWSRNSPGDVESLAINPKGDVALTGEVGNMRFFRVSDGAELKQYDDGIPNAVNALTFSADEKWYAYGLDSGTFATAKSPFYGPVTSATLVRGVTVSGGLNALAECDQVYWQFRPGPTLTSAEPPVRLVMNSTAPAETASRMTFTIVLGASDDILEQNLDLFDYQANAWQLVDSRACFTSDHTVVFEQTTNIERFIRPGTREVRARISWKAIAPVFIYPWQTRVDQAFWNIVP